MPPRITRLTWPRLFPRYEPSPFLYPRWYSVENASLDIPDSTPPKDFAEQDATTQTELGEAQSTSPNTKTQDEYVGIRRIPGSYERKDQVRQMKDARRMQLHGKAFYGNDWRTPLTLLRKHTPAGEYYHVKKLARLEMPQGMRGFYPGNLSNLFLDIYLHTECHVQISRDDDHKDDKFSALELSGTLTSINMARNILNESVQVESDDDLNDKGNMGSYTITASPVILDRVMPRSVWSKPSTRTKELYDVLEPKTWSFTTFAAYVEALISSTGPPSRPKSRTVPKDKSHVDLVTEKLMALYKNPESVRWASMRATVLTLQYLTTKAKIPQVRLLLELVESKAKSHASLRLVLANPAVFNVLLDSASQALDLHTYNFLLRMMTDRGVAPTVETWTPLLQLVQKISPRNAKHIVNAMRNLGMLSSTIGKTATANVTLSTTASEWLRRDESIFDFIAHYDKLWDGKEWLDPFACNQLVTLLVERGNLQDVMPLLNEFTSRNKKPNIVTAHILIDAASSYRNLTFAINLLEATIGKSDSLKPDRHTFDKLVQMAFRTRAYNTLRVVWRYACLSGNVSRELIRKMQKTLMGFVCTQPGLAKTLDVGVGVHDDKVSRHQRFKAMAPIVAVGIEGVMSHAEILGLAPPVQVEDVEMPSASNTIASPDAIAAPDTTASTDNTTSLEAITSPDAHSSLNIAAPPTGKSSLHPILAADLQAHEILFPTVPFMSALRAAADRDLLWKQQGYDKNTSLQTLLAEAVTVQVERRQGLPQEPLIRTYETETPLIRTVERGSPQVPFSENKVREVERESPEISFSEDKVRKVEFESLEFRQDKIRKIELKGDSSKTEPFVFQSLNLESEEVKKFKLAQQEDARKRVKMYKDQQTKARFAAAAKIEWEKLREAKAKLVKAKKLEYEKRCEERRQLQEEQEIAAQKEKRRILDKEMARKRWMTKEEEKWRVEEEKTREEEWQKRQEEERREVESREAEALGEWRKLHEEMRETMAKNRTAGFDDLEVGDDPVGDEM